MPRPPVANSKNLVTVLAWIGIALSCGGVLMSLAEAVLFRTVFNDAKFGELWSKSRMQPNFPPAAAFFMQHMEVVLGVLLAVCVVGLVASIGLLKRRDWARLIFIVLLALGIVWTLASTVYQIATFSDMPFPPDVARHMPNFRFMFYAAMVFGAIWSIGLAGLLGWLIKRLVSADIVAEFRR